MYRNILCFLSAGLLVAPVWGQPREWSDNYQTHATYDSTTLSAPCTGGPSVKYTAFDLLTGDFYTQRVVSGDGLLIYGNRDSTKTMGIACVELIAIGVVNMGQGCPDVAGLGSLEGTEPFTSPNLCMYSGYQFSPWQLKITSVADSVSIRGPDDKCGVANVDDDLNGVTDNDGECLAARPTTVNGGYGNLNGTGFQAGVDAAPGVAGVDDDGNGVVDDVGETGWTGSDDGDDTQRHLWWGVMRMDINESRLLYLNVDMPSSDHYDLFSIREILGVTEWHVLEWSNEVTRGFYQPYVPYNWVWCNSGRTCFGAMLWTSADMANPDETLGPVINTLHTAQSANLAGLGFFQWTSPGQFARHMMFRGNTNFHESFWVVSGNPAQYYPSPSADLDTDKDVDGFDFLTFSNCYNGSNKPPLAACANTHADLDKDGDVDGFDFLTFSNCYNGSNRKPLAACFPPNLTACGS